MEALSRSDGLCSQGLSLSSGNLNIRCAYLLDVLKY